MNVSLKKKLVEVAKLLLLLILLAAWSLLLLSY